MSGDSALPADYDDSAAPPDADDGADVRRRPHVMAVLLLLLPMFGQIFYYMKSAPLMWSLSKAFPVLSLPFAFVLFRQATVPLTRQVTITFLWLALVPSFAAIFYFNQGFFIGITAQVKLLPMLYFFSFLGLLLWLKPNLHEIASCFIICGIVTYIALILLWALVPQSWYSGQYAFEQTPLFTTDNRGNRIRLAMYYGIIALFYFYRRFLQSGRMLWLTGVATGFLLTFGVVKTRAMVVGIVGVLVINSFLAASKAMRFLLVLLAPISVGALFSVGYLATMFSTDSSTGFDVRRTTFVKALEFLGTSPLRWILGVGTISATNSDTLFRFFDHFFFLADITWLGIVFEFGLIGAALFVLFELRGIQLYRDLSQRVDSAFLGSLKDYLIYVLLISGLYPPSLTPGETAVILAIFVYVWQWLRAYDAAAMDAAE